MRTTTKPSRRRFHRVYRPRNTSPIFLFFSPPPPHRGKSDSGGAFAVFPSDLIYIYIPARVCVCVIDARVSIYPRARSTSRDISLRPKKGSRSHRERERKRERERSQGEGSAPPLSFSPRCTMGRAVCYPIVWLHFFSHKGGEKEGGVREEERESNRVQADRQLTDVIGTSSRLGGSVRMLGDNLWRIDPLFGSE